MARVLDPATYWRLRYLQATAEHALAAAGLAEARYQAALREAGVDPAQPHHWVDASTSLMPTDTPATTETEPRR